MLQRKCFLIDKMMGKDGEGKRSEGGEGREAKREREMELQEKGDQWKEKQGLVTDGVYEQRTM